MRTLFLAARNARWKRNKFDRRRQKHRLDLGPNKPNMVLLLEYGHSQTTPWFIHVHIHAEALNSVILF